MVDNKIKRYLKQQRRGLYVVVGLVVLTLLLFYSVGNEDIILRNTLYREHSEIVKFDGKAIEEAPEIPVYPGSRNINSKSSDEQQGFLYEAEWETTENVSSVSKWYWKYVNENGWRIEQIPADIDNDDVQLITAGKNGYIYNFSIIASGSESTQIVVEVVSQKQIDSELDRE